MNEKDKKIMQLAEQFCNENMGNRMNTWMAEALLTRLHRLLSTENQQRSNDAINLDPR